MPSLQTLILFAAYFAVCLAGSIAIVPLLKRWKIEDEVNHRSSHKKTTPRGGGFGFVPPLLAAWLIANVVMSADRFWWIALAGTAAFALAAALDDLFDVPPGRRFLIYAILSVASITAIVVTGGFGYAGLIGLLLPPVAAFALLWWVNVVNFMDGIDGISVIEAISLSAAVLLLAWLRPFEIVDGDLLMVVSALILLAAFAFAFVNWHPARVFMGDVGALALGATTGFLFLAFVIEGRLFELVVVAMFYLWDATFTLLMRLWRREPIHQPHRSHGYQLFVAKGYRHDTASLLVGALNLVLIAIALALPWLGVIAGVTLALLLTIGLYFYFVRAPTARAA